MEPVFGPRRIGGPQGSRSIIDICIPNALALLAERGLTEAPRGTAFGVVILRRPAAGESCCGAISLLRGVAVQEIDPDDGDIGSIGDRPGKQRRGEGIGPIHARLACGREQGDHAGALGRRIKLLAKGFDRIR